MLTIVAMSGCVETTEGLVIAPIGRDEASGTREFFWEHVMNKGEFFDAMTVVASNAGIYQTVTTTRGAIGYVGLGYIDDNVKVLQINGVVPTVETILAGTYPIARDLNMFTNGEPTGITEEYLKFLLSDQGQAIVQEEGFVPVPSTGPYTIVEELSGSSIEIVGSTTVLPIADRAAEEFNALYAETLVTVKSGGSGTGISSVGQGASAIGMSSRELNANERTDYPELIKHVVGTDGIAVIVHPSNTYVDNLTMEELQAIYNGTIRNWNELETS